MRLVRPGKRGGNRGGSLEWESRAVRAGAEHSSLSLFRLLLSIWTPGNILYVQGVLPYANALSVTKSSAPGP